MNILILTDSYPYGKGESFIGPELVEWAKLQSVNVLLLPINIDDSEPRKISENFTVRSEIKKACSRNLLVQISKALLNKYFWLEILKYPIVLTDLTKIKKLIKVAGRSLIISGELKKLLVNINHTEKTLIYSYWFHEGAIGAAILKSKSHDIKIITRAHGYDVYENRDDVNYQALKRSGIIKHIDFIAPASKNATEYLLAHFPIPPHKINTHILGTVDQGPIEKYISSNNELTVVSCSYIVPLKRIELIIKGLKYYHQINPLVNITWVHIGGGRDTHYVESIDKLANEYLSEINHSFLGQLKNEEILKYYSTNKIDVFITATESEGGNPVSIMEAISFGIPALATAVGGVSEIVTSNSGVLLDKNFTLESFNEKMDEIREKFLNQQARIQVREWYLMRYQAEKNHKDFIDKVINL